MDREGDEVQPIGANERLRVIEKSLIVSRKPMHYSRMYGTLEVTK